MEALTEVELEVIDVDDEGEKESCLVGRLVMEEHWNPSNLIEDITKAWKPKHGMSSRVWEESKLILFCFDDVMDRDWVLKNQPWQFKGSLFAIQKFTEQQLSSSNNVTIEYAMYWVRLYDVPVSCMKEISVRLFAKQIGILESVDKSDEDAVGTFIRFKVSINITKPLMRGLSIQVKGKHLWLPLKYESLPIYCFSCGTIGHDYNKCQSYNNQNLAYSTIEVRATEEQSSELPRDIVENILSRLPAKYLIRYKSVCKLWETTISDPRFAETHFQQYNNSFSRNLLAWEKHRDFYPGLYVAEIQNDHFRFVSGIQHSRKYGLLSDLLCNCDGLYMKCFNNSDEGKKYLLWNPSCRAYKEIWCPQPIDDSDSKTTFYGIYYYPEMKDYKVVIAGTKHYAVFSCRYNKWGEVKEIKDILYRSGYFHRGVSFNGSFYWLINEIVGEIYDSEIICFDGKVEKFKKLPLPSYCKEKFEGFYLTSFGSHLCLSLNYWRKESMSIWKKISSDDKDSWMEFKVKTPKYVSTSFLTRPICWVSEGEIMLDIDSPLTYWLYDLSKNTFVGIDKSLSMKYYHPVIYQENMFLQ